MHTIPVFYQPQMMGTTKSFSPSSQKPQQVINDWGNTFEHYIELHNFPGFKKENFYTCHDKHYVDGIFNGSIANGFDEYDGEFANSLTYTSASLYYAAQYLKNNNSPVAVSPTSGFHHASYNKANGYCTFNGLMLTAMMLHQNNDFKKIGIIDFDMHYGNGTDDIIKKLSLDYIVHYTAGKKYDLYHPLLEKIKPIIKPVYTWFVTNKNGAPRNAKKPKNFRKKLLGNKGVKFMENLPIILQGFSNCDLIIYQAGADQHENDPYGGLLSYEQMIKRDKMVFEFSKTHNIPVVWNLAGGYQRDSNGTIEPVLKCHRNTMKACIETFVQPDC